MSIKRKIAANTLVQIIGKVISTAIGLLIIGMMTRYLGQEQFGWYVTAITFLQFIGIMTDFGMTPVTAQMLAEDGGKNPRLLPNILSFRLVTATAVFITAPIIAWFFPYSLPIKLAILTTSISFIAIAINQVLLGYYQNRLALHIHALGEVAGRIVLLFGTWLMIHGDRGFLPIMIIITLSSLVYTAVLWTYVERGNTPSLAFDRDVWRTIMTKSWPIALAIIFNVVYLRGDALFLSLTRSQAEVGLYGAAYRVLDVVTQAAMMFMGLLLPLLAAAWARRDTVAFRQHYEQAGLLMMATAFPITAGIIATGPALMHLVAGKDFVASGSILQILALAVLGVFFGAVFGHLAVAINQQKKTLWVYAVTAVITLVGYFIFIPRFGIYGAAWMTVFSEWFAALALFFVLRPLHEGTFRFKSTISIASASLVMGILLSQLPELPFIALLVLGGAIYSLGLLVTNVISIPLLREIFSSPSRLGLEPAGMPENPGQIEGGNHMDTPHDHKEDSK